jgi:holo-[acyl-carrier protein] synthase
MRSGLGIDLIEIDRVERALRRRPGLRERLFTPAELAYADEKARPAQHLAARFAAKEAVIKALGGPSVAPTEIEVVAGEPPTIRLHGDAAQAGRGVTVSVSLTHSRETAAAVALAEPG